MKLDFVPMWICEKCGKHYPHKKQAQYRKEQPICDCEATLTVKDEASPPPLGISVSDGIKAGDKVGG